MLGNFYIILSLKCYNINFLIVNIIVKQFGSRLGPKLMFCRVWYESKLLTKVSADDTSRRRKFIFEKWFVPRCSYTIDSRAIWAKGTRFSWKTQQMLICQNIKFNDGGNTVGKCFLALSLLFIYFFIYL